MISACMAVSVRELRTAVREWACWNTSRWSIVKILILLEYYGPFTYNGHVLPKFLRYFFVN